MTREEEVELAWAARDERHPVAGSCRTTLRDRLSEAQNWRCCYCGERMDDGETSPTFEHIIPKSVGGPSILPNIAISCRRCNGKRGSQIWPIHLDALGITSPPESLMRLVCSPP